MHSGSHLFAYGTVGIMHNENKSLESHFALCVLATFEGNQLASRTVIEPGTAVTMDSYVIYTLNIDVF